MGSLRPSIVLLLLLGFICVANSSPFSLFGKSDDDKAVEEEKGVKDATESTTTTASSTTASSCSGLGGFFHLCDKKDPTEEPKKVKRDLSEADSSDCDSDENKDEGKAEEGSESTTSSNSEVEVAKRQVGDPEAPVLGEVPPVVGDAIKAPETPEDQEDEPKERRQVDDSDDQDNAEDKEETSRRRRDCRDSDGVGEKDCRKKREYVPPCFGVKCAVEETTTTAAGTTEEN